MSSNQKLLYILFVFGYYRKKFRETRATFELIVPTARSKLLQYIIFSEYIEWAMHNLYSTNRCEEVMKKN